MNDNMIRNPQSAVVHRDRGGHPTQHRPVRPDAPATVNRDGQRVLSTPDASWALMLAQYTSEGRDLLTVASEAYKLDLLDQAQNGQMTGEEAGARGRQHRRAGVGRGGECHLAGKRRRRRPARRRTAGGLRRPHHARQRRQVVRRVRCRS